MDEPKTDPQPDPGNSPPEEWTAPASPEEQRDVEIILAALAGTDDL